MQTDHALVSGEGVRLELTRAGVGSRTIAAAIDVAVQLVALTVLLLVEIAIIGSSDDAATAAVLLVEVVLVLAGYPIVAEWTTRGRTIGKACLGLRVVRDDGGPIAFRHALTRGLAGLVVEKPGLLFPLSTMVGVFTVALSSSEKRVGDMMAGTVVLNERAAGRAFAGSPYGQDGLWVPPPLQPWAMSLDLHRLDDALALRLRQFVGRAHGLTPGAQYALGEDLRHRVLAVVANPPPPDAPTAFVLTAVLVERRRRAELAARPVEHAHPAASPYTAPYAAPPYATAPPGPPPPGPDSPFAPPR